MTGFGEAHHQENGLAVTVEIRAINSRYFKLTIKSGDGHGGLESEIEGIVRQHIRRGTVQISLWIDRPRSPDDYRIDTDVLDNYRQQLEAVHSRWHVVESVSLEQLLQLPGVVNENSAKNADLQEDWPTIRQALEKALTNLDGMRQREGTAMKADLRGNTKIISAELEAVAERAPSVVESYRDRIHDRVTKTLEKYDVSLEPSDLIREVSIFAERSDISEEVVRMRSHLEQFASTLELKESTGRKLEFLTQEMVRETNTIGSKSNDVAISRHVIEIKAAIEKIREMIQNVE